MTDEEYLAAVMEGSPGTVPGLCLRCNRRREAVPHCPSCGYCHYTMGSCLECGFLAEVVIEQGMGHRRKT